jgi:hypothetical protein
MFLTIPRLTHWGLRVLDAHASDALGRYEVLQIKTLWNGVTKEKCIQIFLTKYQVFTSSNGNKHDLSFPSYISISKGIIHIKLIFKSIKSTTIKYAR